MCVRACVCVHVYVKMQLAAKNYRTQHSPVTHEHKGKEITAVTIHRPLLCDNRSVPLTHETWINGRYFIDDFFFKCTFLKKNFCIFIRVSLKFVFKGPIDNTWALFGLGGKPLPEPITMTHLCCITSQCAQPMYDTIGSRYIAVQYNTMLHTMQ